MCPCYLAKEDVRWYALCTVTVEHGVETDAVEEVDANEERMVLGGGGKRDRERAATYCASRQASRCRHK